MESRAHGAFVVLVFALSPLACTPARREPVPVQRLSPPSGQAAATAKELEAILLAEPSAEPTLSPYVTADELEEVRSAVLRYYVEQKPWHWEAFAAELREGWISQAGDFEPGYPPAFGGWQFGTIEGRFALVRSPPMPEGELPTMLVYFGVYLAKEGGAWRVTGEYELQQKLGPAS